MNHVHLSIVLPPPEGATGMQLEHLELFLKIAKEKSISKVADISHISQPALSLQMQKIEEVLGCRLFERSNRGIQLTDAGHLMQRYATQLIFTYNQFLEELENLRNNNETCRVIATHVAANYAIPCTLVKAKEHFPGFTFTLASMSSHEVIRHVQGNQADIGFIVGEANKPNLYCRNIISDQIVLVAAKEYQVKDSLTLEELKAYPLIMLDENYSSYNMIEQQLKSLGFSLGDFNVSYNLDYTEGVKSMVVGQNGLAFLPYMAVKKEIYHKQLKIVEIRDLTLRYDLSIIYNARKENCNFQMATVKRYFENIVPTTIC